jgi:hypothetical protein
MNTRAIAIAAALAPLVAKQEQTDVAQISSGQA